MKKQILFLFLLASLFSGNVLFGMKRKRVHEEDTENLEPAKKKQKQFKSDLTFYTPRQIANGEASEWETASKLKVLCRSRFTEGRFYESTIKGYHSGVVRLDRNHLSLISKNPNLTNLTLERGYRIAILLRNIFSKGRLTTLKVVYPESLNNTSIKHMFKRQPKNPENYFVSLTLEKCRLLTSEFVKYLPNSITTLSVKDCKKINKNDLVCELKKRARSLPGLLGIYYDGEYILLAKPWEEEDLQQVIQASLAEQQERRQQEIMPPPEEGIVWPAPIDAFYLMP